MCENECCFSILRLGILESGDGIDRMLSEEVCHLHFCFCNFCLMFSSPSYQCFECVESSRRDDECEVCMCALLLRDMVITNCYSRQHAVCISLVILCIRVFYLMDIAAM